MPYVLVWDLKAIGFKTVLIHNFCDDIIRVYPFKKNRLQLFPGEYVIIPRPNGKLTFRRYNPKRRRKHNKERK